MPRPSLSTVQVMFSHLGGNPSGLLPKGGVAAQHILSSIPLPKRFCPWQKHRCQPLLERQRGYGTRSSGRRRPGTDALTSLEARERLRQQTPTLVFKIKGVSFEGRQVLAARFMCYR